VSSEGRDLFAGRFSSDFQEISHSFSGLPTGEQTVSFFDDGGNGWGLPMETALRNDPELATSCEDFYFGGQLEVCRLCLYSGSGSVESPNSFNACETECSLDGTMHSRDLQV
jgi:hypothetical protein